MVVDCHHAACVVTEKKILLFFFRIQNLEKSHLISIGTGGEFRPLITQKKIPDGPSHDTLHLFPSGHTHREVKVEEFNT